MFKHDRDGDVLRIIYNGFTTTPKLVITYSQKPTPEPGFQGLGQSKVAVCVPWPLLDTLPWRQVKNKADPTWGNPKDIFDELTCLKWANWWMDDRLCMIISYWPGTSRFQHVLNSGGNRTSGRHYNKNLLMWWTQCHHMPPIIWEWFMPPIYGQGWFIIGFTTFVLDTLNFGKFWFGFTESVIL